jgi:trimeric autotransporter adhesin
MKIKTKILMLFLFVIPLLGESQTWNNIGYGFFNGGPTGFTSLDKLYIGTDASTLAGIPVRGICSFDGQTQVDSLNEGLGFTGSNDAVWCNGKLIVGGGFSYAGINQWAIPNTQRIAAWDSLTGWQSITPNGGASHFINCLSVYNNELYAGGAFISINNVSVNRIAKWNGTQWTNVGGGVQGGVETVYCMAVYHNQLYVGGDFYFSGSNNLSTNCIARWNGTVWDSVGSGVNLAVFDMVVDTVRDVLYVGGGFTNTRDTTVFGIAQWNDSIWLPVGTGLDTLWGTRCLEVYNGELYAGGVNVTTTSQGDTIRNIYKFNGIKWVSVDGGANSDVYQLAVFQGNLYVGGSFWQVGYGINASRIACYGSTCPTSVGISEEPPSVPFKMFPNPTKDILRIETEEPNPLVFRLVDLNGKLIVEKNFTGKLEYNTKSLAVGTYLVQVSLEGGTRIHTEKLVVE